MTDIKRIEKLISEAKRIAIEYNNLTGKPLGITGEIAEFEAAQKLGLELCNARQPGFDAIRMNNGTQEKIQIKGRRVLKKSNPGQRIGRIRFNHEWDFIVLVLLDEMFEPCEMYEANRSCVVEALRKPGSKAINERGSLSVSKFKNIADKIWTYD